ncbi:MAG: ATP synthase F1 subunit delta [Candidatus Krumholzibacteria bacterium]|jgi:F-type H+-transporting ATPase subunit delta|nr:ATP synthase F1 subunit delta [Candidatus Krumholzibacteria bacterium]MDP6796559.1 ATP synthase F1 subunit delta [Candidatus Krumholzibacteria bacterium]MDP7021449.1 ATP synthase F1 subunit delta [Candidatus Krumholzibacteria bacterium]
MRNFAIAKVYATAVLELAREKGELAELLRDLEAFAALLEESSELQSAFYSPEASSAAKARILDQIFPDAESVLSLLFLKTLVRKNRESAFGDILSMIGRLRDEEEGILLGTLFSATELAEGELQGVESQLGEEHGKQVKLEHEVDGSLLSGMILRMESHTIDGSLKTRLRRMKNRLMAADLGKE